MPITTRLLAQNTNEENQWLRVDYTKRYIVNKTDDWQFLFGPFSELTVSTRVLKLAAEFDTLDFNSIRIIGYLYDSVTDSTDSASSCTFKVYQVNNTSGWTESLLGTFTGVIQPNSYYFTDILLSSLVPADLSGDSTLMLECTMTRLTETFRDRIYVNHLGVFDSILRLRQDVEFLDITKQDE